MKRADWNLLAIAAAGGQPLSPVQLQKSLFLFQDAYREELGGNCYNFVPYDYGPFAVAVYHDAEAHQAAGHVSIMQTPGGWSQYAATPAGLDRANELATQAPQGALQHLRQLVTWARGISFQQLVRAVYEKHPEYRENSVFRG
jgi:hypothetical protein